MSNLETTLDDLRHHGSAEETLRASLRLIAAFLILATVLVSTRPFPAGPVEGAGTGGDLLNQLTFSGLAVISGLMLFFVPRQALRPLVQPGMILLIAWITLSVLRSDYSGVSFRAFAFNIIIMFLAAMVFVLPERLSQFQKLLLATVAMTLALSYLGVIALPGLAKHTDFDPFEPEHAGSWKGHFTHKNITGAVMACYAIIAIYAMRIGYRRLGLLVFVASVVFLVFTKSKTSLGLLPVALILAFMAEKIRWLPMRLALTVVPVAALVALTLGSAIIPDIASMNKSMLKDPGFTGRYDIWRYGFEKWSERLWSGYGFEAFWQTDTTLQGESKLELAWAVEKIIHGHNSYLDIGLTMGVIGLVLVSYVFVLKPVLDFHACADDIDTRRLTSMFLGMWIFISLDMNLETYYFRRSDPVWFLLLLAVFGLRFTATFPVQREPAPAG
jgi:O-antigen ligase